MTNMLDWLAHCALSHPQGIALIQGDQRWSYAELNDLVASMAGQLAAAGVGAGQHVAVLMPNRVEVLCLIHALPRLGAVLVPLNTRLTPDELRWQVDQAGCSFLICSRDTQGQAAALRHADRRTLSVDPPQEPPTEALRAFPVGDVGLWRSRPLDLGAVQCIVYTSGTTGEPKGAMLTYGNHLWSATASAFRLGTDLRDRWLVCLPLYHVGGLVIVLRCCLYGTTVVLQACPERSRRGSRRDGFDPSAINRALDTQGITLVSLVPTMLQRLLEARGERPMPATLRCILLGGAAAPPVLLEKCLSLNLPVATTYGLTEAASQVATALPADVRRKPGSVGKPLMFSEICIVGDDGQDQPAGEIGEIVVRGPTVMRGYYDRPQATREALRDGELHTGDMGYLDEEGDLWVVQRRTDLIVMGGENVYPAEVEQALLEHPDVQEACVVGVEDEEWGQWVAAAVVVREKATLTEDNLIAFCRERLAGYKQPRMLRFVDALPRTASGKVHREAVARRMANPVPHTCRT